MGRNKGKGGPVTKSKKADIISKLKTLILDGEIDHKRYEVLAERFKTTRQTIGKYVDEIYKSVPQEEVRKVIIDFSLVFEKLEVTVNEALAEAQTVKEKTEVIKTYFQLIREKTDFLERFFIKEKVADKIDLNADIKQTSINVNISTFSKERITEIDAMEVVDYDRLANNS